MSKKSLSELTHIHSLCDDYDPNSMAAEQAREYIKAFLSPVKESEKISLMSSLGRILAENIVAPHNVPNHDNSAMDGYAFCAKDLAAEGSTQLKVTGSVFAGNALVGEVQPGACIKIMTGAAMPTGVDTVIPQERVKINAHGNASTIEIAEPIKQGANVRYAGEDLAQGQIVLPVGHMIKPADLGLIASLGVGEISVYHKLRVSFFSRSEEHTSELQSH